jgi:hypothetical protein
VLIFELVTLSITAAFGLWLWFPSERMLRARGERFARENLAFVDSEFVPAFNRAWTWTQRMMACAFVTLIVTMLVVDRFAGGYVSTQLEFMPLLGLFLVCVAGVRLRMAGREFPVPPRRSVIARPRRVELRDYVSVPARAAAWVSVLACLGLAIWAAIHPQQSEFAPEPRLVPLAAAVALLGAVIFVEVVGRAMCGRSQSSVDPCHLYLQDAWRGGFLLGAYVYVCWGAYQYLLGAPIYAFDSLPDAYFPVTGLTFMALLGLFFQSRRRFRVRLWPTLLPGQVLLPGQPVPPRQQVAA